MSLRFNKFSAPLIGNVLEYYDFTLYGALAPFIIKHFFSPDRGSFLAFLTYALSFLMRPIGAIVFGFIGDIYGRKKAFGAPLMLMSLFTMLIFLIPSYEEIGVISSAMLILCRIGQGFCMGGEYGGAVVFSLEHRKNKNLGFFGSIIGSSALTGSLLAQIVSFLFTLPGFPHSFWRVPFLIGSIVGLIGFWIRYRIEETPEFVFSPDYEVPVFVAIKQHLPSIIKGTAATGLSGLVGVFAYVYVNFLLVNSLGWDLNKSLLLIIFGHIVALFTCPLIGFIIQKQKRDPLNITLLSSISTLVIIVPIQYMINTNSYFLIIVSMFSLSFLNGIGWGTINLLLFNSFPTTVRYTGVAISESLGRIIFAAPLPFFCSSLLESTHFELAPALVVVANTILILIMLGVGSMRFRQRDNIPQCIKSGQLEA